MLTVCLPGTGGMLPLPGRWLTCCWMEFQGKAVLIDCGEGTQIALRLAGRKLSHLELLLITHFHADHIAGLPGLLLTLGNTGRTEPLLLAGPPGLGKIAASLLVIAPLPFPVEVLELKPGESISGWDGLQISSRPLMHRMPCYGYRVQVDRKPVFLPERAKALGVPHTSFRLLHAGESVTLADGRLILPEQVLGAKRAPFAVSYTTDTQPVDAVAELAFQTDLMIAEGLYAQDADGPQAHEKGHMTFADAARLATLAQTKRLWLTHFSPALTDPQGEIGCALQHFAQAQAAFDGIDCCIDGNED